MLSWIVNIVLAFVLIKFIVYPGLGLLFGTTHPVVAVVSGSMEHAFAPEIDSYGNYVMSQGKIAYRFCDDREFKEKRLFNLKDFRNFDSFWNICGDWYEKMDIQKEDFSHFIFRNGFNTGDIIVLVGSDPKDIKIGDVIVFQGNRPDPIIHRVVNHWEEDGKQYFQTKGDHNPDSDPTYELDISEDRVIGKAVLRIPVLGYIKIWFVDILQLLGIYKYVPI